MPLIILATEALFELQCIGAIIIIIIIIITTTTATTSNCSIALRIFKLPCYGMLPLSLPSVFL
jgi:hypothetical protein